MNPDRFTFASIFYPHPPIDQIAFENIIITVDVLRSINQVSSSHIIIINNHTFYRTVKILTKPLQYTPSYYITKHLNIRTVCEY